MLCWLALGEHEAFKEDMLRSSKSHPRQGNTNNSIANLPVAPPSAAPPWEAQMLCWLAFGEHEALKRDMKRVGILIPA